MLFIGKFDVLLFVNIVAVTCGFCAGMESCGRMMPPPSALNNPTDVCGNEGSESVMSQGFSPGGVGGGISCGSVLGGFGGRLFVKVGNTGNVMPTFVGGVLGGVLGDIELFDDSITFVGSVG